MIILLLSFSAVLLLSVIFGLYLGVRKAKEYESGIDSVSFNPRERQECVIENSVSDRESELPPTVSDKRKNNASENKAKIDWLVK